MNDCILLITCNVIGDLIKKRMVSGVSILQLCFNIKIADNVMLEGAGLEGGHFGCLDREQVMREKRVGAREVRENEGEECERDREDREKIKQLKGEVKASAARHCNRHGRQHTNIADTAQRLPPQQLQSRAAFGMACQCGHAVHRVTKQGPQLHWQVCRQV